MRELSFLEFLKILDQSDAENFLRETAMQQGNIFVKYIQKPKSFEKWWHTSFVWIETKEGFIHWNAMCSKYIGFYNRILHE